MSYQVLHFPASTPQYAKQEKGNQHSQGTVSTPPLSTYLPICLISILILNAASIRYLSPVQDP
jgi:hypothetical protein